VLAGFIDAKSWPLDQIPGPADFYVLKTTYDIVQLFLPCVLRDPVLKAGSTRRRHG